ncbi:phage head spike fiber domain-containing protein [Falsiroseomonas oryzae]|uniref:phage head spike fiber domain-containing protein n=1 Tax=Falsiroseomonas oryzae TaxID=2766473 RepID=UPI0022EB63FC|nr:hypothetical protein [Roseomonas sp. MO-31]
MSTSALPALLGISGDAARRLVSGGALLAPATLARAQVTSRATALGADNATLQVFGADQPRFAGAARRLLTEGQRTNEITDPVAFGAGSGWSSIFSGTGAAPVITPNYGAIAAPDGSFTATRLQLDKGAGTLSTDRSGLSRTTTTTAARFVWARTLAGTATVQIGTSSVTPGVQSSLDTTWRRFGVSDGGGTHRIMVLGGGSGTSTTADLLVWGASSEAGVGFASSLILPPAGSPQSSTRGADLVSAPLAALGVGGNGACTLLWSGAMQVAAGAVTALLQLDDGTNALRWVVDNLAGNGSIRIIGTTGTAAVAGTAASWVSFRLGLAVDGAGRAALCMNGGAIAAATGGPTAGFTTVRLGTNATGGSAAFAETAALQVIPFALSDAALQAAVAGLPA